MTWNYRIVAIPWEDETEYAIYEVYYDDDGKPIARTEQPVGCIAADIRELAQEFKYMSLAFTEPVLHEEDFRS